MSDWKAHGLHACNGNLFGHENPRSGERCTKMMAADLDAIHGVNLSPPQDF